jgi:uncharacterized protein
MPLGEVATYLGIGVIVGFFAGLLGIGGGIIIVSTLAPPWSVGFVYLPAFVGISITSTLRRIFALLLVLMGIKVAVAV